jgi:hypothetical protein
MLPVMELETPPRVWRKPIALIITLPAYGNTSTCVEKTLVKEYAITPVQKHLHVCGENRNLAKKNNSPLFYFPLKRRGQAP